MFPEDKQANKKSYIERIKNQNGLVSSTVTLKDNTMENAFKILEENYFLPRSINSSQIIKYEKRIKIFSDMQDLKKIYSPSSIPSNPRKLLETVFH